MHRGFRYNHEPCLPPFIFTVSQSRGTTRSTRHASLDKESFMPAASPLTNLPEIGVCALMQVVLALPVHAQSYPAKPIRLIVPWPPGGGVDISARTIGPRLSEQLGQPVVVDNRGGAAGMIGTEVAARAPADGYTILHGAAGPNAILPLLNPKAPYGPLNDFAEVAHFANTIYVLVVHPSLPAQSIKQLVALAKATPGKLTIGASGTATPAHISGELLRAAAGIDIAPVFYRGAAGAVLDVLGGQISMTIETISPALPHVRSGKLRALGVTAAKRSTQLPEVPTIAESGFPGFEVINWYGILTPASTPRDVIARLNREINSITRAPEIRSRLIGYGLEVVESTPEEYTAFRKADVAKWTRIIKETNLRYE
jgi:tripartite-type tricarboxylate transporter receptor subunit TctC